MAETKNPFEELIDSFTDDVEKQSIRNIATKYPELKNGYLRQSDYSRNMNTLAEDRKKYEAKRKETETELAKLEEWNSWRVNNWDDEHKMTNAELKKMAEIQSLTSELEILRASQEAGMTFEEVGQYLKTELSKQKLVDRDYLEKEFRKDLVDRKTFDADLNTRVGGVANGMEYLYDSTLIPVMQHKEEFGEWIKPSEIIKYANENGIKKIEDAYERMVAPKRTEIQGKKNEEAIKAAEERGRQAALKEKGMGQDGKGRPVDDGAPVMGHMERRLRMQNSKAAGNEIPDDAPLGTRSNMIAAKYRQEKAEGKSDAVVAEFSKTA